MVYDHRNYTVTGRLERSPEIQKLREYPRLEVQRSMSTLDFAEIELRVAFAMLKGASKTDAA